MKTFVSDIIPKIQRFSRKLDELTLLTNQHWVLLDDSTDTKNVYIFRDNNELLISSNGRVIKAKWEYLGNNSLLIDKGEESFLYKHGFFDSNVLALKVDSQNSYVVFINENKYQGELNTIEDVNRFLIAQYPDDANPLHYHKKQGLETRGAENSEKKRRRAYETDKGIVEIELKDFLSDPSAGNRVLHEGEPALNGKYKVGFYKFFYVINGVIVDVTWF